MFGALIGDAESRTPLLWGYLIGAALMFSGGVVAWFLGVDAERKSLESVARPLAFVQDTVGKAKKMGREGPLPEAAG